MCKGGHIGLLGVLWLVVFAEHSGQEWRLPVFPNPGVHLSCTDEVRREEEAVSNDRLNTTTVSAAVQPVRVVACTNLMFILTRY